MEREEQDWVIYLDDTIRRLSDVSSSVQLELGLSDHLPQLDMGYNEELTISNLSSEPLYLVRGSDIRITVIPPNYDPIARLDTLDMPNINVMIRQNMVNRPNPKKASHSGIMYRLDSEKLVGQSVYISELGAFLCLSNQLERVRNWCRTRYNPIAPSSATPIWIHAHSDSPNITELYATVNRRIVKVPVLKGECLHAKNRLIYYQWDCPLPGQLKDFSDSIPMAYFYTEKVWETKQGEFVSTSHDELKEILQRRGIDMDFTQSLRDMLSESQKEVTLLRSTITRLTDPAVKDDILEARRKEYIHKRTMQAFDVVDRVTTTAKNTQDIHEKYQTSKRKAADDKFLRVKQTLELGSSIAKLAAPIIGMVTSVVKLLR